MKKREGELSNLAITKIEYQYYIRGGKHKDILGKLLLKEEIAGILFAVERY